MLWIGLNRFIDYLRDFHDIFTFSQNGTCSVALNSMFEKPEDRTRAVANVIKSLGDKGIIPGIRNEVYMAPCSFDLLTLQWWYLILSSMIILVEISFFFNQMYPVKPSFNAPVFFSLERAAAPYFGLKVIPYCPELFLFLDMNTNLGGMPWTQFLGVFLMEILTWLSCYLIQGYGVHMNGYVERDGQKFLWIGKRSLTKSTYPGMLDHLVAGGLVRFFS